MGIDPRLLRVIACPRDQGPLLDCSQHFGVLYNPRLRLKYPVVDLVPVLVSDQAVPVGPEEHALLTQ